jgi:hypothetical protein
MRLTVVAGLLLGGAVLSLVLMQCSRVGGRERLVEVFDNGPPMRRADGTSVQNSGPSEGYRWVGAGDEPPEGKHWRVVNFDELTAEQRARIRQ